MCSQFLKRMDNYQGDLTDILRASGSNPLAEGGGAPLPEWQFPGSAMSYTTCPADDFGQPFPFLRDPLVHDVNDAPVSGFFHTSDVIRDETAGFATVESNNCAMRILDDHEKRPPNIFSRMLQISPTAKLSGDSAAAGPPLLPPQRGLMSPNNSKSCLIESPGLQISSPRNTGIRRRKSQAKKVVCIPAPAPANSRSTGEVVPSDLWAWRKYGQKPIKGSPYPRGYYRCSSSKGCSARKQVERSRTDPNMLVITYTSEHNHPWPTQRNALAGSTRSQPSKTSTAAKTSPNSHSQKPSNPKEEQTELTAENASSALVKEEMDQDFDNQLEIEDDQDLRTSYKPMLPEENQSDDFFADLGEIETDSLDMLLFDGRDSKGLDPFSFFDWSVNTAAPGSSAAGAAAAASSIGASSKDL